MAGQIKKKLDLIIEERSQGNRTVALTTKTKLVMRGIHPDKYDTTSEDDPKILAKIEKIAIEFGVPL